MWVTGKLTVILRRIHKKKNVYFRFFFLKTRKPLNNIARNENKDLAQWMMLCYP
jgi:hypothetical protein